MAYKRYTARRRLGSGRKFGVRSLARKLIRKAKRRQLTRYIKKVSATNAEWKMVTRAADVYNVNSVIADTDAHELMPYISQGTKDMQRIADRIQPGRYLKVRCRVNFNMNNSYPPNPMIYHLRVLIISMRQGYNHFVGFPAGWSGVLLKQNDGVALTDNVPYDGTEFTSLLPVNKEIFKVHYDKTFKITVGGYDTTVTQNDNSPNPNIEKWFTFKVKLPKKLIYENADNSCVNFNPFWCAGWTRTGQTAQITNVVDISIGMYPIMWYKDM